MSSDKKQIAVLPENLPQGAKAFQSAVDGKLTKDVWEQILAAQIEKAKAGDRGAAKFLLEYAGGVASMRGATFVQENHHHDHFHESDPPKPPALAKVVPGDVPDRTVEDYEAARARRARQVSRAL